MIAPTTNQALLFWLDNATHGLPPEVKAAVRGEIEARFADAIHDHQAAGMDLDAAQQAALTDLGEARQTARHLHAAYLTQTRCLLAIAACLVCPLVLGGLPYFYQWLGEVKSYAILDAAVLLPALYILFTFKELLFSAEQSIRAPFRLLVVGVICGQLARLGYFAVFGQSVAIYGNQISGPLAFLRGPFEAITLAAELATSVGLFLTGLRLNKCAGQLYGLMPSILLSFLTMGILGIIVSITVVLQDEAWGIFFSGVGYLVMAITLAMMALLFYRVGYRQPGLPRQTA